MIDKKIIIFFVACMLLVLLVLTRKKSPLQEIQSFTVSTYYVNCDSNLFYLDISTDSRFRTGPRLFTDNIPIIPGAPTAIDGDSLFVGVDSDLYQFNPSFEILRKVSISEFGFDSTLYRFSTHAYAFEGKLWITAQKRMSAEYRPEFYFIIQWDTATPPDTRKVSPEYKFPGRWAIDTASNMLYVPGRQIMYHNFDTGKTQYKDIGFYAHADFQDNKLLLSGMSEQKNYPITLIDLHTQDTTFLDTGAIARWGPGGMIYYCKGTTQLWRMDSADRKPQALYRATRFSWYWPAMADIELSQSGRFLSFLYAKPKWIILDDWMFIIVDLREGTYRSFPKTYIGTFSVALWESDQMNRSNKQVKEDDAHAD
jgi:hypothetical protein